MADQLCPLPSELLQAVYGPPWQRQCCRYKTTYTHDNIVAFIRDALPCKNWCVIPPTWSDADGFRPCNYPTAPAVAAAKGLARFLGKVGPLGEHETTHFADMVDGHCETVASALAARVVTEVRVRGRRRDPASILHGAFKSLECDLTKVDTAANHIAVLFAPARVAIRAAQRANSGDVTPVSSGSAPVPLQWKPYLWCATPCLSSFVAHHCLGVGSGLVDGLVDCGTRSEPYTLPAYVLNYVWDNDELDKSDLACPDHETAVYSLHCIALVVDPKGQTVYVADPNGSLIPGSNIEYLSLPLRPLCHDESPSTCVSQYNREDMQRLPSST
jgi:hypothetical protein